MVLATLWLWLTLTALWLAEAARHHDSASVCALGPCQCDRGKVLCDCSHSTVQKIVLKRDLFEEYIISFISVRDCEELHVKGGALQGLVALQHFNAEKIRKIALEEHSFSWTTSDPNHGGLLVNISNSAIPEVPSHAFRGSLREVLLTSVNISRIRSFAFATIDNAEKIEFSKVSFRSIDPQAFKKFSVGLLLFSDVIIDILPTRTMINIEVLQEMRIYNSKIGRVETEAFRMSAVTSMKMIRTTIDVVEGKAFQIFTKGDVFMHNNRFSNVEKNAFVHITVDSRYAKEAGKQDFVFENNTLVTAEDAALTFNTSGFDMMLDWITIDQQCSCENVEHLLSDLVLFSPRPDNKSTPPRIGEILYCINTKATNVREYKLKNCDSLSIRLVVKIILITGVAIALVGLGVAGYIAIQKKRKAKRYINVPSSSAAPLKPADLNKPHILVVPDGKTYRETELQVIVEHLEPIIPTEYVKDNPDNDVGENR